MISSIDLICPSYDRPEKVSRMVASAVRSFPSIRITINCLPCDIGTTALANAEIARTICDAVIYTPDDIEFSQSSIPNALKVLNEKFPDGDGMIGFKQSNIENDNGAAVGLVGQKFIDRFPARQLICPDYRALWGDTELKEYALSINKYHYCESALIKHYHPFVCPEELDRTHKRQKRHKQTDNGTRQLRQSNNFLWGRTFDLVHGK